MQVNADLINAQVIQNKDVALCTLNVGRKSFEGTAKRNPIDPNDPQIAHDLAVGRALIAAGKSLVKGAYAKSHEV